MPPGPTVFPRHRCFHSISFPSEWGLARSSIRRARSSGFHSISFPSEWGLYYGMGCGRAQGGFHSISFPSEWGRIRPRMRSTISAMRFHSISFPSEWGPSSNFLSYSIDVVSIQLVSPASGDNIMREVFVLNETRFHSISFPSEWGRLTIHKPPVTITQVFPFN